MGESSSRGLTTGDDNITIGYHAGRRDTNTESKNIFIGSYTGEFGDQNSSILIGAYNGRYGNGSANVYIGNQTGKGHSGDSGTSNYNVFLGASIASYWGLTSATNNVVVGYQAGRYFTDNDGNTLFSRHGLNIRPVSGRVIIFPPTWDYPHSGLAPKSNPKYIMSTYIHYGKN